MKFTSNTGILFFRGPGQEFNDWLKNPINFYIYMST